MVLVPFPFSVKERINKMSLITTNDGRIVLKKAASMMAVPYVYDQSVEDYVLGGDVYDISAVIGDSITIEQSDGNTEAKYNEFKASPLIESVSGSKYNFTAQCLDLQNSVLQSLFGVMVGHGYNGAVNGAAAFNDDFVQRYALVRIRFADASLPDVILPKVQLNSKLFIQQLKTRASQGNIAGTALALNCCIKDANTMNHLLQFSSPQGTTYTPYTPVLFVPKGMTSMYYRKEVNGKKHIYTTINFTNGNVSNETMVNPIEGTWATL
jgi:hypothetical protein